MLGSVVLLIAPDSPNTRRLEACLRGGGNDVCLSSTPDQASILIEARAADLILADVSLLETDMEQLGQTPLPVLLYSTAAGDFAELLGHRGAYFVGLVGDGESEQSIRNVALMAERILRRDFFGMDKYIRRFGVDFTMSKVTGAGARDDLVSCVRDLAQTVGARRRDLMAIASVADELLTNAIYDAPTTEFGHHKYAHKDRRSKVELGLHEQASLSYGCDGYTFALSVCDNFGSLSLERICERLVAGLSKDQIESKEGGAGLGMYSVLMQCDELIINIEPGKRTEIIALIDLARTSKVPSSSLQVSYLRPQVTGSAEVTLSSSLRQELCAQVTESRKPLSYVPLRVKRHATGTITPRAASVC